MSAQNGITFTMCESDLLEVDALTRELLAIHTQAMRAKDAEIARLQAITERHWDARGMLASAADLLNSWAREFGVPEAKDERAIKDVINALWDRAAALNFDPNANLTGGLR